MKLVYIVMGTYQENSGNKFSLIAKCDILTVTESLKWCDNVVDKYKDLTTASFETVDNGLKIIL